MPTPVIMPKFEMAQETGKVLAWLKREGDLVNKGEALLEVETDKVNQEVESPATGVLTGISAQPGQVVPIASPIAYILKPGESAPAPTGSNATASSSVGVPPGAGAGTATGTPSLLSSAGEEPRVTPLAARLAQEHGLDLHKVTGTGPLGRITKEDVAAAVAAGAAVAHGVTVVAQAEASEADGKVRAVPAARRIARELGVDLHTVRGTGPLGRIQPEDVRAAAAVKAPTAAATAELAQDSIAQPVATSPATPPVGPIAVRRVVPLSNIRKTIAERMTTSVREAPQFTVSVDVQMGRSLSIVDDLKAGPADPARPKITLTALLVKAVGHALTAHPGVNAAFSEDGIVEYADVNVGVATALEGGLIVPVVRNADRLGLRGIAAALSDLTGRAREGKLKLDDLQGGTFTVSNLGMFGIDTFTAILNPPQAAILAVGRVSKRAIVVPAENEHGEDRVEVKPMSSLTLTADHRVLDGASAARFLATIQTVLEHPGLLLE